MNEWKRRSLKDFFNWSLQGEIKKETYVQGGGQFETAPRHTACLK